MRQASATRRRSSRTSGPVKSGRSMMAPPRQYAAPTDRSGPGSSGRDQRDPALYISRGSAVGAIGEAAAGLREQQDGQEQDQVAGDGRQPGQGEGAERVA